MNPEGETVWKKLTKKDLIMGPRTGGYAICDEAQDMLNDLKDKLDDTYTVFEIRTTVHPTTFQPHISIILNKTEKK